MCVPVEREHIEFSINVPTSPTTAGGRARPGLEPRWETTRAGIYVTMTDIGWGNTNALPTGIDDSAHLFHRVFQSDEI